MRLHYDYDELRAALCQEANAVAENLENPSLLFVRKTKYDIIEQVIQDYYDSGKALKYHNQYCMDNGYDSEVVTDISLLNGDAWLLRDTLSEWYPLFVNTIISDYKQEQLALENVSTPVELAQKKLDIAKAKGELEKQRLEEEKRKTEESIAKVNQVFATINGVATVFFGMLGLIFKPVLLIALFFLSMCGGFTAALIKDTKKKYYK